MPFSNMNCVRFTNPLRCTFFFLCLLFPALILAQAELDQFSVEARCPFSCARDGNWALYSSVEDLSSCNKTVLLQLNLYNNNGSQTSATGIRSCLIEKSPVQLQSRQNFVPSSSNPAPSKFDAERGDSDIQIFQRGGKAEASIVEEAIFALRDHIQKEADGTPTALFAKSDNAIVGVYSGLQVKKSSVAAILDDFPKHFKAQDISQVAAQSCKEDSLSTQILGIFVDTTGNLAAVQSALASWDRAECVSDKWDTESVWADASISMIPGSQVLIDPGRETLSKRQIGNTCSYTRAESGDGCWALADRCKITQDEFVRYNGDANLCNTIQLGKYYCCSAGSLPDFTPQPNPDETCQTHTVGSTDLCGIIAEKYSLTVEQLQERNKNTWGWQGCQFLMANQKLCISTGEPPMPAVDPLAVCGPTVAGTQRPSDMSKISDLNPCPLKACCNVWGNCGISKDFCIRNPADTGAPGTTKPGANSCISSCGLEITNNGSPPSSFMRIGYFEGWNLDRPCLHMLPRHIDTSFYTHLHFAFGGITSSFEVDMSKMKAMWDEFKSIRGSKRILSFGGWSFSTDADTAPIFREGVTDAQRVTFANNVVKFAISEGIDGLDFDWEYPGAPDMPGIPPGSPNDGKNYLQFLKEVRK
ncbi:unnamed protein product [Periconia digitata]|uniref:Chitinase n=1 Tax=Periconia digitata TaxID=1303443 RepID=A0A9W4XRZ9_9PLEO|nr:unnamed protein product [Periconia digitata]